jgi:uncharacterized protein YeaO (DUF488 family)
MSICLKCKQEFIPDNFHPKRKFCSEECRNQYYHDNNYYQNYNKSYAKKYKEINKNRHQKWHKNLKFEVLSHYSNGTPICACCGEKELSFLSLEHVNNDGAKHKKELFGKRHNLYSWLKNNSYQTNYKIEVLCMNCQFGRRYNNGICPHKVTSDGLT